MHINRHYAELQDSYLFSDIARRVAEYQQANPKADVIRLGIGDVTRPLCPAVVEALSAAVREMGEKATFRGYGPEQGYDFLRQAIQAYYGERGIALDLQEVFISDGAKSDLGNILDLFEIGQYRINTRSGLSGVCGYQYHGRPVGEVFERFPGQRLFTHAG